MILLDWLIYEVKVRSFYKQSSCKRGGKKGINTNREKDKLKKTPTILGYKW